MVPRVTQPTESGLAQKPESAVVQIHGEYSINSERESGSLYTNPVVDSTHENLLH
jgi:hypothetical protein